MFQAFEALTDLVPDPFGPWWDTCVHCQTARIAHPLDANHEFEIDL